MVGLEAGGGFLCTLVFLLAFITLFYFILFIRDFKEKQGKRG